MGNALQVRESLGWCRDQRKMACSETNGPCAQAKVAGEDLAQLFDDELLIGERHLRANAGVVGDHVTEHLCRSDIHELVGVRHETVDDHERRLLSSDPELLEPEIRV